MNIGIMSMQRIINYGSFLQAWGLKCVLEEMGHNVQFVDYTVCDPIVKSKAIKKASDSYIKKAVNMLKPSYRKKRSTDIKVNSIFSHFTEVFKNEYLPELGISDHMNICPNLDVLIIGSDEVFNCLQDVSTVGYSLELFGKNNNANKVISYAASFGSTTYELLCQYDKSDEIAQLLKDFDDISVRDENSQQLIYKLIGKKPVKNIDPVLLYDFESEVPKKVDLTDYVLLYSYCDRMSEEEGKAARDFAHSNGKKLISVGFWQSCCDTYVEANPFEVLAYFKNADYIITDTFHGTIMSLKYGKKFVSFVRESNKNKMIGLLSQFGLEKRIVENTNDLTKTMKNEINFELVSSVLEEEKNKAKSYLSQNLNS